MARKVLFYGLYGKGSIQKISKDLEKIKESLSLPEDLEGTVVLSLEHMTTDENKGK